MNTQNNTVQLKMVENKAKLDLNTMLELDSTIALHMYELKHLTQIMIEVSDDMNQHDVIASIVRDLAEKLHGDFYKLFEQSKADSSR